MRSQSSALHTLTMRLRLTGGINSVNTFCFPTCKDNAWQSKFKIKANEKRNIMSYFLCRRPLPHGPGSRKRQTEGPWPGTVCRNGHNNVHHAWRTTGNATWNERFIIDGLSHRKRRPIAAQKVTFHNAKGGLLQKLSRAAAAHNTISAVTNWLSMDNKL